LLCTEIQQGIKSFDEMSNMSREKRARLVEALKIDRGTIESDFLSDDGTRKLVVGFGNNDKVESMLPMEREEGSAEQE
jgi:23S rRNA (adenine2503-C2)-methyltransferase